MKLIRFIYVLISVVIISMVPESTGAFGISTFIFGFGMVYDYAQAVYGNNKHKEYRIGAIVAFIGLGISIVLAIFGIMVLIGCFNLVSINGSKIVKVCIQNDPSNFTYFNFSLSYSAFARILLAFPFLAGIEGFFVYKRLNQIEEVQTA